MRSTPPRPGHLDAWQCKLQAGWHGSSKHPEMNINGEMAFLFAKLWEDFLHAEMMLVGI